MIDLGLKPSHQHHLDFRCGCRYEAERDVDEPTLAGVALWALCRQHRRRRVAPELGIFASA